MTVLNHHPAACLLSWLIVVITLQYLSWSVLLGLLVVIALAGRAVVRRWAVLARRARWLLLTLWFILAYGTPGEAWLDLAWAPTEAGTQEASLQAVRLVIMLGLLAWLFETLPRQRLMAGLWALVRPLRSLGIDADRVVVRLALVFDYLEKAPPRGSWRHLIDDARPVAGEMDVVRIELPAWRRRDAGLVAAVTLIFSGLAWLR